MRLKTWFVVVALLLASGASGLSGELGTLNPDAPAETAQFSFLIGEWDCSIRRMALDGSLQDPMSGKWTGKYILNGWAIQDFWTAKNANGTTTYGTNIRSFDPTTGKWVNRWLSSGSLQWLHFEAEKVGDTMVMIGGEGTDGAGRAYVIRNLFHDITAGSWKWRQDRSFDGGLSWIEGVAVLTATRAAGSAE